MSRRALLAAAVLAALARLGTASAHPLDLGRLDVQVAGERVDLRLSLRPDGWAALLGVPVEALERQESAALPGRMLAATLGRTALASGADGAACSLVEGASVEPGQGSLVTLAARARCPGAGPIRVAMGFLGSPEHPLVVTEQVDGGERRTRLADATRPALVLERGGTGTGAGAGGRWSAAGRFVLLGVEHIFTGWDHLLFLLGLLLAGGSAKRLFGVVSAFTAAHSLTLALAALSIVRLPERVVEPAIAASIVVVAALNLAKVERGGRWLLAFGFGLVHGFGFASALAGLGLGRAGLVPALVGFNLGVELGQAALVLVAAPALGWLRRRGRLGPLAVPALSLASIAVGAVWFVGRALP